MLMRIFSILILFALCSCNGSGGDDLKDALDTDLDDIEDIAGGIPRRPIDPGLLGINSFVNDSRFGSISQQFLEVRDTLRLGFVRVLMAWDDKVQPSPSAEPDFVFYDSIVSSIPPGLDVLVILTGAPSWMGDSANWVAGNPRVTFAELWVRKVVSRYAANASISAWEIWNEPNAAADPDNITLGLSDSAVNYVEMLASAYGVVRELAPGDRVVGAATTAINQNFPDSLRFNESAREAGAEQFVDVWAIHYYGRQFENVVRGNGVMDFINSLSRPVWVTESGAQGVDQQLAYGEQVWPFLTEKMPSIQRIYIYQFTEDSAAAATYGLRNLDAGARVSDLYLYLMGR